MGGKVQGKRSIKDRFKMDRRRLKIVQEIKPKKDLICTTHGYELRGKNAGGTGSAGGRGIKERKQMGQL